jgi:hypothetical protein
MTPNELLARCVAEFPVMYLDAQAQGRLLTKALTAYQEKVGPMGRVVFPETEDTVPLPSDFASAAIAMDADSVYHESAVVAGQITIATQSWSRKPFSCYYFRDIQNWGLDTDLPTESIHLIAEFLSASLAVLNTERGRAVSLATGLQMEFPGDAELRDRVSAAILDMEESQAIIPGVVVM